MLASLKSNSLTFSIWFKKQIMLFSLFILPKKLTCIYVNLSILALIYHIKNKEFNCNTINTEKFKELLDLTLNEDILLLPNYTYNWIWSDSILHLHLHLADKEILLIDAIKDESIFHTYTKDIVNELLINLPKMFKIKLGLGKYVNDIVMKNKVMNSVIYNF